MGAETAIIAAMVAATVVSAAGTMQQGKAADRAARFEARQRERQAKREFAAGTRESHEAKRRSDKLISDMRAQAAASGGTTDDPGMTRDFAEAGTVGKYNALAAMYDAESRAQGRRFQAKARRLEGKNAKTASRWRAMSTVLSGASRVGSAGYDMGTWG